MTVSVDGENVAHNAPHLLMVGAGCRLPAAHQLFGIGTAEGLMEVDALDGGEIAKAIQPIICFPNMVSIVIVAYLVYGFLGGDGWINNTLLGGDGISWYSQPQYWPFILTIVHFWKGAGYGSIIYIATMSGIDPGLYEAARLDGATKWQQIKMITLPIIRPMIILMLLMSITFR